MAPDWAQAVRAGDVDQLDRLVHAGSDVNSRDRHGQTGLMVAATRGHSDAVRFLIDHGAELDHTAKYHLSALILAVLNGHTEIVRMLVDEGADLTIQGTGAPGFYDQTAADLARAHERVELVALLGSHGPGEDA